MPLAFRIELVGICVGTEECIPPLLPTRRLGVHDGIGLRVASIGQLAHLLASAVLVVGMPVAVLLESCSQTNPQHQRFWRRHVELRSEELLAGVSRKQLEEVPICRAAFLLWRIRGLR